MNPEAVAQKFSVKKVFFSNKETLVQVFSCKFCKISKNTSSYRTSLVAASVNHTTVLLKCDSCLCQNLFLAFSSLYEKTD